MLLTIAACVLKGQILASKGIEMYNEQKNALKM